MLEWHSKLNMSSCIWRQPGSSVIFQWSYMATVCPVPCIIFSPNILLGEVRLYLVLVLSWTSHLKTNDRKNHGRPSTLNDIIRFCACGTTHPALADSFWYWLKSRTSVFPSNFYCSFYTIHLCSIRIRFFHMIFTTHTWCILLFPFCLHNLNRYYNGGEQVSEYPCLIDWLSHQNAAFKNASP